MENKKNNCGVSLDKDFLNAIDKKMDCINDEDIVYTYVCNVYSEQHGIYLPNCCSKLG